VTFINIFTPKPGKLDEFLEIQVAQQRRFAGNIPGWRGSRLHRSLDGTTAAAITIFDSVADHQRWLQTEDFKAHFQRIEPLIERADRGWYELVQEAGQI
jgi:heme-degrading monooxygenase HmoA